MMNNDYNTFDPIVAQAADWLSCLDGATGRGWDDPEFLRWMDQSDRHRLAFAELSALWFGAGELDYADDTTLDRGRSPHSTRRRILVPVTLALALLALAVLPDWHWLWLRSQADVSATQGIVKTLALPDGSTVKLAGNSAARWLDDGRGLELLHGELLLDVVSDPANPFRVRAGDSTVTVLGTTFGVYRRDGSLRVGVLEGRVSVTHGDQVVNLKPGDQVVLDSDQIRSDDYPPDEFFSWAGGQLVIRNRSLAEVVERLQPFVRPRIFLRASVAPQRLSAVVALESADRAIDSLARQAGVALTTLGPVHVLH